MSNSLYLYGFIATSVVSLMFFIAYLITLRNLVSIKKDLTKEILDNYTMMKLLDDANTKFESNLDVHNESFVKFLSDSRDWAFQYIEDVQGGLAEFIDSVDADIEHFDQYGDVISTTRPDYWAIKRISEAYKKLKKLLPEDKELK